jgi:hypothetical protein
MLNGGGRVCPRIAEILRGGRHVSKVPNCDIERARRSVEKPPAKAAFNLALMIFDQAAINAGFDFRRYAMKPRPAKPISSIAHVLGSGTAGTAAAISTT